MNKLFESCLALLACGIIAILFTGCVAPRGILVPAGGAPVKVGGGSRGFEFPLPMMSISTNIPYQTTEVSVTNVSKIGTILDIVVSNRHRYVGLIPGDQWIAPGLPNWSGRSAQHSIVITGRNPVTNQLVGSLTRTFPVDGRRHKEIPFMIGDGDLR